MLSRISSGPGSLTGSNPVAWMCDCFPFIEGLCPTAPKKQTGLGGGPNWPPGGAKGPLHLTSSDRRVLASAAASGGPRGETRFAWGLPQRREGLDTGTFPGGRYPARPTFSGLGLLPASFLEEGDYPVTVDCGLTVLPQHQ